jgi:hypothetical protein
MKRAAIIVATAAFGIGAGIGISACGGDDTTTTVIQPSGGAKKKAEETSGTAGEEKAEAKGTTTTTGTDTTTTDDDNGGGGEDDNGGSGRQRPRQRPVLTSSSGAVSHASGADSESAVSRNKRWRGSPPPLETSTRRGGAGGRTGLLVTLRDIQITESLTGGLLSRGGGGGPPGSGRAERALHRGSTVAPGSSAILSGRCRRRTSRSSEPWLSRFSARP